MSWFDQADESASAAVARVLNEIVTWKPMRVRGGGRYTSGSIEPDPERQERDLEAVVTWGPELAAAGDNDRQGQVISYDCVVDFERRVFEVLPGAGEFIVPKKPDHFIISDAYQGNTEVEVERVGDDGSKRIYFYCIMPQ